MSTEAQEAVAEVADQLENVQEAQAEESTEVEASPEEGEETPVEAKDNEEEVSLEPEEGDSQEEAELKRMIKKLKLKVDGEEIEEELPFEIPEEHEDYIKRQLQMAKVANKRMQQYSEIEKDAQDFFAQLKEDPLSVLGDESLGIDVEKVIEDYVNRKLEDSKKTPEQLELEKAQEELKKIREEQKRKEEEWREAEMQRLEQQEMENYDLKMSQALEGSTLPKSPYVVKKMADMLLFGLENGVELEPADVLPLVEEEVYGDIQEMFSVMPQDQVKKILGSDFISGLRKADIEKAKSAKAPQTARKVAEDTATDTSEESEEEKAKRKQTFKQFFGV